VNNPVVLAPVGLESASALGLMVLGGAILVLSVSAMALGLPLNGLSWWVWLVPIWALIAIPLGWKLRRRSAAAGLRNLGRAWLIAAVIPLVVLLGLGKPLQKAMLEQQAVQSAPTKGN
jgi:hypothetical protein